MLECVVLALFTQLSTFLSMTYSKYTLQKQCKCTLCSTEHTSQARWDHRTSRMQDGSPVNVPASLLSAADAQWHSPQARLFALSYTRTHDKSYSLHTYIPIWHYGEIYFTRTRHEFYEAHRPKFPLLHFIYQHRVTRFLKSETTG